MDTFINAQNPPWCNGRGYCNATPPSKIWCYRRPPPHWWIASLTGFTGSAEWVNGTLTFAYVRTSVGKFPYIEWFWHHDGLFDPSLRVEWRPNSFTEITSYHLTVNLVIAGFIQQVIFGHRDQAPVDDWTTYDETSVPEIYRSPLWDGGDDLRCTLQLGTYARMPAKSCRGDYNGEWP